MEIPLSSISCKPAPAKVTEQIINLLRQKFGANPFIPLIRTGFNRQRDTFYIIKLIGKCLISHNDFTGFGVKGV